MREHRIHNGTCSNGSSRGAGKERKKKAYSIHLSPKIDMTLAARCLFLMLFIVLRETHATDAPTVTVSSTASTALSVVTPGQSPVPIVVLTKEICSIAGVELSDYIPEETLAVLEKKAIEAKDNVISLLARHTESYISDVIDGTLSYKSYAILLVPKAVPLIAGIVLLFVWLILCCPMIYFRDWRRYCPVSSCCREKERNVTFHRAFFFSLLFTAIAFVALIFTSSGIYFTLNASRGVRESHCSAFSFVRDLLLGISLDVPSDDKFIGLKAIKENMQDILDYLSVNQMVSFIDSVTDIVDGTVNFTKNREDLSARMELAIDVLSHTDNNPTEFAHTCICCKYGAKPVAEVRAQMDKGIVLALSSLRKFIDKHLGKYSTTLDKIIAELNDKKDGVGDYETAVELIKKFLFDTKDKSLQYSQSMLKGFVAISVTGLLITLLVFIWLFLIWCVGDKNRVSSTVPCVFWNMFCFYAVLAFVAGGIFFLALVPVTDVCHIIQETLIEKDMWKPFFEKHAGKSDAKSLEPFTQTCLARSGDGDMAAVEMKKVSLFRNEITKKMKLLETHRAKSDFIVSGLELMVNASIDYSWLFLPDLAAFELPSKENTHTRRLTYPEVLRSGVQDKDVMINSSDTLKSIIDKAMNTMNSFDTVKMLFSQSTRRVLLAPTYADNVTFNFNISTNAFPSAQNESRYNATQQARILKEGSSLPKNKELPLDNIPEIDLPPEIKKLLPPDLENLSPSDLKKILPPEYSNLTLPEVKKLLPPDLENSPLFDIDKFPLPDVGNMKLLKREILNFARNRIEDLMNINHTVYGLETVQSKIAPFHLMVLTSVVNVTTINATFDFNIDTNAFLSAQNEIRYNDTRDARITEDGFPLPDPDNMTTINLYATNPKAQQSLERAVVNATIESQMWLNAIWWATQKQKVRESKNFYCIDKDNWVKRKVLPNCTWEQFAPYIVERANKNSSYIVSLAENIKNTALEFKDDVLSTADSLSARLNIIIHELLDKFDHLFKSLNCRFFRKIMLSFVHIICGEIVVNCIMVSVSWIASGLVTTFGAMFMILAWRNYVDNDISKKERINKLYSFSHLKYFRR